MERNRMAPLQFGRQKWELQLVQRVRQSNVEVTHEFKIHRRSSTWLINPPIIQGFMWPFLSSSVQFSSVAQSCPTLCDPMNHSTPGLPVHHQLSESTQTHIHWVSAAIQPSHLWDKISHLCYPLLLLPSIFPSIRVCSDEAVLRIRWPKYWSFSFNISPSNEHPGLISFRMDWLDLDNAFQSHSHWIHYS